MIALPRLYAILDAGCFPDAGTMFAAAEELARGGCTLLQYRNKRADARVMFEQARELKQRFSRPGGSLPLASAEPGGTRAGSWPVRLIMNDRADLCVAAGLDGVHIGQDDLSPESVRKIISSGNQGGDRWLGVSTHNADQLREADLTSADYLAIGPVFATSSKQNPDPVVGLEGVRRARGLTRKPLVAIGGITRANAASVIEAGADSVAVISDLLADPRKSAEEFFRVLR
jgi:thiamine-phosphate pyrophosphorylase